MAFEGESFEKSILKKLKKNQLKLIGESPGKKSACLSEQRRKHYRKRNPKHVASFERASLTLYEQDLM